MLPRRGPKRDWLMHALATELCLCNSLEVDNLDAENGTALEGDTRKVKEYLMQADGQGVPDEHQGVSKNKIRQVLTYIVHRADVATGCAHSISPMPARFTK